MNTLSVYFCCFALLAFAIYWTAARFGRKTQNAVTIALGLFFIGFVDYRFSLVLSAVALGAYLFGLWAEKTVKSLWVSVPVLLSGLLVFKYYNFFATTFGGGALTLILPLGISFYTFMAVSYVVDVAKAKIKAERSLIDFCAFLMFFPQLTAGPIGRAEQLLRVFKAPRVFDYELAAEGCRQILWGAFKKMYIADCLGKLVVGTFAEPSQYGSAALWTSAVLYSIQIYADFSGYTDIAIGIGKVFGVRLMKNFDNPYFATTIGDFWRRWHISLTTWFRDYLYFPLGGSRCGQVKTARNTLIVFLVSGLWHGANWTFALWGALHGVFLVAERMLKLDRIKTPIRYPFMLIAVVIAWVAFRADNLGLMVDFYRGMFIPRGGLDCARFGEMVPPVACMFIGEAALIMLAKPIAARVRKYLMMPYVKWPLYIYLIYAIFYNHPSDSLFIYAQF